MANGFNKEEVVLFEDLAEGFFDDLVLTKAVSTFRTDATTMERANNTIWRPVPYIGQSFSGTDATSQFKNYTQLSVPATLGYSRGSAWTMTASELRDALQEGRIGDAARQKLSSDINVSISNVASLQGAKVIKRTVAATGYDDIALADAALTEIGVGEADRVMVLNPRDYNAMAGNLAARQTMQGKPTNAYESAYVGEVAGFETLKAGYTYSLGAAAGGALLTMSTLTAAGNYYTPKATSTAATGEMGNVDNRYQTITISSTTGVAAGDCFTIAGVNSVHMITKGNTGQLQTFRVISVTNATTMVVSPPIISGQGATDAELQYQNCVVTQSGTAAITFLNTAAARTNVFWHKDAIEVLPGRYAVPNDAGVAVMRFTAEAGGIELVAQKWYDINTMTTKYRVDTLYGVVCKAPQMAGIMLFNQV